LQLHLGGLQLRLRPLRSRQHEIADIARGLIEEETHALAAEGFGDDVELDAAATALALAFPFPQRRCWICEMRRGQGTRNAPVLVDHISDSPPLVHDLAPAVPVEEFTAQLAAAHVPGPAVRVTGIFVNRRQLLSLVETLLEPEEMPIDALAIGRVGDILHMRMHRLSEQLHAVSFRDLGVAHGVAEGHAFVGHRAAGLCAALLEAARGCGLVGGAGDAVHFVVGELDEHLHVGVWGAFEALDQVFAVALVGLDFEVVLPDQDVEVGGCTVDLSDHGLVDVEVYDGGFGKVGAGGGGSEVDFVGED